ncbi:MAG: cupin domain-containing protein [Chloroflexota bacterium]|nr:cupin domain-containing protein [Chloroflexota bacterium]
MFAWHRSTAFAFGLAIIVSSCGGAATPSPSPAAAVAASPTPKPQDAVGFVSTKLADGPLDVLPTLPLFINVLDVPQPPASPIQHAHIAGFVYAVTGVHQLTIQASAATDVKPGEAAFVPGNVVHTHANPGTTANEWYFMGLRNTGARTGTPLFPGQTTLYETPDLPVTAFPPGKYVEQLNVTTLEKGGRTASHKHGGVEVLLILDGTVTLRVAGQQPQTLTKGKGAFVPPNTTLQATNTGDGQAKLLAYFVGLDGAPFSTNVDTLP